MTPKGNKQGSFETFFKKLNQNNLLTKIRISPKEDVNKLLSPFKLHKNQTHKWWKEYNNSKHRLPYGIYVGTIGNVMNALGALAILHDLSEPIKRGHNPSRILNGRKWRNFNHKFKLDYERLKNSTSTSAIILSADRGTSIGGYKSEIFYLTYEYHI